MHHRTRDVRTRTVTVAMVVALLLLAPLFVDARAAHGAASSGGTLRVGQDLSGSSVGPVHFDPTEFTVAAGYYPYTWPIYAGMLRLTPSGSYVPDLASKVSVPDPSTIEIALRPKLVFSDGTTLDADAVKAGLERNMGTANKGAFNASLFQISSIDVKDPQSLTLHFSTPVASTFYPQLADQDTFIVSPKAATSGDVESKPVGAGPFVLKQFAAGDQIVLEKNPRYWNAKAIKLSGITYVNVTAGPQQINALKSNLIDATTGLAPDSVPALKGDGSLQVKSSFQDGQFLWMPMCKESGPLADVKVRQALNFAIDRDAINKALLYGQGEPAWSLYSSDNALYDKSLTDVYAYNIKKAKKLLKDAGYADGFSTSVVALPSPITNQVAQVAQDQWKKIGVSVELVPTTDYVNDFYVRHVAEIGVVPSTRTGLNKVTGPYEPGSIGNACGYSNPQLHDLVTKAQGLPPDSPELKQVWDDMQQFVIGNALSVYVDYTPVVAAGSTKVQHLATIPYIGSVLDFWGMSVK
jgi:peptide/nickel transport system substrate-binding protein